MEKNKMLADILGTGVKPTMSDDLNLKDFVFIRQTHSPKIHLRFGRFGEEHGGFFIKNPISGLVEREYWDSLKVFQTINLIDAPEVVKQMGISEGGDLTIDQCREIPGFVLWEELIKKHDSFMSTIEEFNLIVGISSSGVVEFRRTHVMMGSLEWEEVESKNWNEVCNKINTIDHDRKD